jgi:hypothetical protein
LNKYASSHTHTYIYITHRFNPDSLPSNLHSSWVMPPLRVVTQYESAEPEVRVAQGEPPQMLFCHLLLMMYP